MRWGWDLNHAKTFLLASLCSAARAVTRLLQIPVASLSAHCRSHRSGGAGIWTGPRRSASLRSAAASG